jgi:hypothetical protein
MIFTYFCDSIQVYSSCLCFTKAKTQEKTGPEEQDVGGDEENKMERGPRE